MVSVRTDLVVAAAIGLSAIFVLKGIRSTAEELPSRKTKSKAKTTSARRRKAYELQTSSSSSDADSFMTPSPPRSPMPSTRSKRGVPKRYGFRPICMNCDCPPKENEAALRGNFDNGTESLTHWQGFTMDEARQHADDHQLRAMAKSPREIIEILQKGNVRFWTGSATRPEKSAFERRALISKQFPSVAVLGCADSRVPIEIVFDMGLGDMFVVRVAGNCLDNGTQASLQFAVVHLQVKVVLVLGHEGCGAIKAAQKSMQDIQKEPTALAGLLGKLHGGLNKSRLDQVYDARAQDREAVVTNVKRQVADLTKDDTIMSRVKSKDLIIVGGMYEISSGIVDFVEEVSDAPLAKACLLSPRNPKSTDESAVQNGKN